MGCKDARETRFQNMSRRVAGYGDFVTGTNSIAVISDRTCSWISSCGWAREDSEHDRGTSTVSCRHDDVGKVWRAVTILSLSLSLSLSIFRLAVEFIWTAGYRLDIEKSSFFVSLDPSCWQLVRQMAGACRLRRQTSQYRISSRFKPSTLCKISYLSFLFLHIITTLVTSPRTLNFYIKYIFGFSINLKALRFCTDRSASYDFA